MSRGIFRPTTTAWHTICISFHSQRHTWHPCSLTHACVFSFCAVVPEYCYQKKKSHSPSGSWTRSVRRREKAESHQWELVHRRHHGTQAREMCPPDENPTRAACPCSKSISHSLTSPPLWCHSFILFPFPVAMVTMPLGADHSFTSVFLSPSVSLPLSRPRWAQPTHSIWGVQLHP